MKTGLFTNWLITSGGIQFLQWKNVINLCKLYQKLLNMFLKLLLLPDYDMLNYSNYTIICNGTTQTGIKLYFQRRYTGRLTKTGKAPNWQIALCIFLDVQTIHWRQKPPEHSSCGRDLIRWSEKAVISQKVIPKAPRKTIECLMPKTGISEVDIYSRQGHDPVTSLRHINHHLLLNTNCMTFSNYL